jgi:hypothetical protein
LLKLMQMIFKKKRKKPSGLTIAEVTGRVRGFILDSQIQDAHELCQLLGCSPLSEELQDHEEVESDLRVERIDYLIPILYSHSNLLSEAATEYQKDNMEDSEKISKEVWAFSRNLMSQVAFSTLVGSVSQLVDMGLLEIPKKKLTKK